MRKIWTLLLTACFAASIAGCGGDDAIDLEGGEPLSEEEQADEEAELDAEMNDRTPSDEDSGAGEGEGEGEF